MRKRKVSIIIAAYNEEKVIGETISKLKKIVTKENIYVVDDGSEDKTTKVAKKYTNNVLTIKNKGKAYALNEGIKHFNLSERYKYITPTDADSNLAPDFFKHIYPIFENDKHHKIIGVVGKVVGRPTNWLTNYRMWEYELAQVIHKGAQSKINSIVVCPGPCTVFRSEIFKKTKYPLGTITEDMDMTFRIHRKKLGSLIFQQKSKSITQDPNNLHAYTKQITRWYTGFWQCLAKHNIPKGMQKLDAEVTLLAFEGIFSGLFSLSLIFILPYLFFTSPTLVFWAFITDLILFMIPTMSFVAYRYKEPKIFMYLPHFYFLRLYSSLIFLKSYGIVMLGSDKYKKKSWDTTRYTLNIK